MDVRYLKTSDFLLAVVAPGTHPGRLDPGEYRADLERTTDDLANEHRYPHLAAAVRPLPQAAQVVANGRPVASTPMENVGQRWALTLLNENEYEQPTAGAYPSAGRNLMREFVARGLH